MVTLARKWIQFRRKFVLIFLAGIVVFSYLSSGAIAESRIGALALSDLNEVLLDQSVELRQEVRQALEEAGKDDVGCVAPLVYRPFSSLNHTNLNHTRVAPFSCSFTDHQALIIEAINLAILPSGEAISLEELLHRNIIPEGVDLQFNLMSWRWTEPNS